MTIEEILELLASHGITTSICYGPSLNHGSIYSVDVLTEDGRSFNKPFACRSINQAAEIALKECRERGWIKMIKS